MFNGGISIVGTLFSADQLYIISCIRCFRDCNWWRIFITIGLGSGVGTDVGTDCLCIFKCGLFPVVPRSNVSSSGVMEDTCDRIGGGGTGYFLDGSPSVLCGALEMVLLYTWLRVVASAYRGLFLVLVLPGNFANISWLSDSHWESGEL